MTAKEIFIINVNFFIILFTYVKQTKYKKIYYFNARLKRRIELYFMSFVMNDYLLVGIGAAGGGMARYWLAGIVQKILPATMPYGTLTVNIIGGFIIGFILYFFDSNNLISPEVKILLTIGFCGGLTTFSAFSLETFNMFIDAEYLFAFLNIFLNVFFSLLATGLGFLLSKLIWSMYGN